MSNLKKNAVAKLKEALAKIESGEYEVTSCNGNVQENASRSHTDFHLNLTVQATKREENS